MKKFNELTEIEKALRSLIYAVETRNEEGEIPKQGEFFLSLKLLEVKKVAERHGIPLVETPNGIQ